jgi:hypothetical protein
MEQGTLTERLKSSGVGLLFLALALFFILWFIFPLYILFKISVSISEDVLIGCWMPIVFCRHSR